MLLDHIGGHCPSREAQARADHSFGARPGPNGIKLGESRSDIVSDGVVLVMGDQRDKEGDHDLEGDRNRAASRIRSRLAFAYPHGGSRKERHNRSIIRVLTCALGMYVRGSPFMSLLLKSLHGTVESKVKQ